MKKELLSERDLKALLGLAMIVVAALAYFIGFKVFLESATVIKNENVQLETRLADLRQKDANKQNVMDQTEDYKKKIDELVMKYPSKVTPEKVFYDMCDLDVLLGKANYTSVVAEMNGLFYPAASDDGSTESTTESTDATQTTDTTQKANTSGDTTEHGFTSDGVVTVYKTQVTSQIKDLSYSGLKTMIKAVKDYDGRMTMDSMNLKFAKESGLLEGTITYELYALEGSPKEYVEPDIKMQSGVNNIFGTFDAK